MEGAAGGAEDALEDGMDENGMGGWGKGRAVSTIRRDAQALVEVKAGPHGLVLALQNGGGICQGLAPGFRLGNLQGYGGSVIM